MGFSTTIARRGVGLSKSYLILGVLLGIYGLGFTNAPQLIPKSGVPTSGVSITAALPFMSVAMLSLVAILIATPVELIFVYDRNNGVLEYLLSTGMDQMDIFKGYLKAALLLAAAFLLAANLANVTVGLLLGVDRILLSAITVLTFAIGVSAVAFVTVAMMAFSSLQKTPLGANQPLGIVLGIIPIFPFFVIPLVFPSLVILVGFVLAAIVAAIAVGFLLMAGRLILRERLLP